MEEQKSIRSFHLRLPYDVFMKLKVYCAVNDIPITEFIIRAIKKEMKDRGVK